MADFLTAALTRIVELSDFTGPLCQRPVVKALLDFLPATLCQQCAHTLTEQLTKDAHTRLSLSLRLSDRKKASVVARRLNALLLEIELLPRARMATKEQLAKIFALEIESMRDEIEKLDRAAKRSGSLRDSVHREADRQVGYAYRLLEAYGPAEDLRFETGSEVHEALLEVGATEGDMPFITETFRSEREGVLADRNGRTKSPFLRDVLHRMAQVGLDDTALNRDAATEEIFRARADVLLASADDPRKPKLSGGSRRSERAAAHTDVSHGSS